MNGKQAKRMRRLARQCGTLEKKYQAPRHSWRERQETDLLGRTRRVRTHSVELNPLCARSVQQKAKTHYKRAQSSPTAKRPGNKRYG